MCVETGVAWDSPLTWHVTPVRGQVPLLRHTMEYYNRKSAEWMERDTTPVYCVKVGSLAPAPPNRRCAFFTLPSHYTSFARAQGVSECKSRWGGGEEGYCCVLLLP